MAKQPLNGQLEVEVVIIAEDGTSVEGDLWVEEVTAFEALDRALKSDPVFRSAYANARLVHAESNRGISAQDVGRYYLRYQHDAGITEFWGHHANAAYVDREQGSVGISVG